MCVAAAAAAARLVVSYVLQQTRSARFDSICIHDSQRCLRMSATATVTATVAAQFATLRPLVDSAEMFANRKTSHVGELRVASAISVARRRPSVDAASKQARFALQRIEFIILPQGLCTSSCCSAQLSCRLHFNLRTRARACTSQDLLQDDKFCTPLRLFVRYDNYKLSRARRMLASKAGRQAVHIERTSHYYGCRVATTEFVFVARPAGSLKASKCASARARCVASQN